MTITKGLTTVVLTGIGFGVAGAGIGYLIGSISPEYYRIVFRLPDPMQYDGRLLGLAVGLGQGVTTGVVVGLVIAILVTWYEVRKLANKPQD